MQNYEKNDFKFIIGYAINLLNHRAIYIKNEIQS